MTLRASLLISAYILAACSGGSSSEPPPPPPEPVDTRPPIFVGGSTRTIDVEENTAGFLTLVLATDPSGGRTTFAVVPDEDSAFFHFNEANELSLISPRDFENPEDADANNSYIVTIEATDNDGNSATQTITVNITDVTDTAALERVVTGLSNPLGIIPIPGDTRLAIVEQTGAIKLFDPATNSIDAVNFLSVGADLPPGNERGLLGLAFPPDFQESGTFYINLTSAPNGRTEIRRYQTMSGMRDMGDPATADIILAVDQPRPNHNAGWIGFAPDGTLIIPTGDGGGAGDPFENAQDTQSLLGKILRIDVSGDDFPDDDLRDYSIPAGNAFTNIAEGAPEIFALGLRNPFQSTIDPESGDLIIADVGQGRIEEVDRLDLTDGAGTNFGWNIREGTQAFRGTTMDVLTDPVAEYEHNTTDRGGFSITGGVVHQGNIEALERRYLFADFVTDNIWSLPVADLVNGTTIPSSGFTVVDPATDVDIVDGITAFGTGADGTTYVAMRRGDIYRFVTAD